MASPTRLRLVALAQLWTHAVRQTKAMTHTIKSSAALLVGVHSVIDKHFQMLMRVILKIKNKVTVFETKTGKDITPVIWKLYTNVK